MALCACSEHGLDRTGAAFSAAHTVRLVSCRHPRHRALGGDGLAWLAGGGDLPRARLPGHQAGLCKKQELGLAEGRGGRRGPENVWGSAFTGLVLALLIAARIGSPTLLLIGFSASFAAKLADTFGSEIGKRWGRTTLLITNLRPVPAGTEGAVSVEGTLASALGSLLMTLVMGGLGLLPSGAALLLVLLVGFVATLLESLLGAVGQGRWPWLSNELVNGLQTAWAAGLAMLAAWLLGLS